MTGVFVCLVIALLAVTGCAGRSGTASTADEDTSTSEDTSTNEDTTTGENPLLPETPTLELSFSQVKQFDFSWTPAMGAEHYQLFERADVDEPWLPVSGDILGESISLTMPLHFRSNASYGLLACNAHGCSEPAVLDVASNLAEAVGYFKASNTGTGDGLGVAVALSSDGNTLVTGARGEGSGATGIDGNQADESATGAGAAYVFVHSEGVWSQQAYVKPSNTDELDEFGAGVALSSDGNTMAVGATWEDSSATGVGGDQTDNSAADAGAVYVFVRSDGVWSQQAYVKASNTGENDWFGYALALSSDGNTMAVGTYHESSGATGIDGNQVDDSALEAGAVYVFTRNGNAWSQQAYIKPSNTGAYDHFGIAVALSSDGNIMIVGAPDEDSSATGIGGNQADDSAIDSGAAYVFVRSGGVWSQQAYVKASNAGAGDTFGITVALSSDATTLAVGATGEASSATGIDGNQADDSIPLAGAVYVFVRDGDVWSQQAYVKSANPDEVEYFGRGLALSNDGNVMAVGAPDEDSTARGIGGDQADDSALNVGAAYVFVRSGDAWSQHAYVKASNTGVDPEYFGLTVALSGDGNTMAAGAYFEHSSATGIGGDQDDNSAYAAGAVYVY